MGIGNSVSRALVNGNLYLPSVDFSFSHSFAFIEGMARCGGGTAVYVKPGERMEAKVLLLLGNFDNNKFIYIKIVGQLKNSMQSALRDINFEWGIPVIQTPPTSPPIFSRVIVYGFSATGSNSLYFYELQVIIHSTKVNHINWAR